MGLRIAIPVTAIITFLFLNLLLSPSSYAVIRTIGKTVSKVSNGDTLQVITQEGTKLMVRLYGCDAPETEKETGGPEISANLVSLMVKTPCRLCKPRFIEKGQARYHHH